VKNLKLNIGQINNLIIFEIDERGALLKVEDGSGAGVMLIILYQLLL